MDSRIVFRRDDKGRLNLHAGTPQLLLADTAWNGIVRSTPADWRDYLAHRAGQGFNAVLTVLSTPWRALAGDARGETMLRGTQINAAYFDRLEEKFAAAADAKVTLMPVMLWACTPPDPGQAIDEDLCTELCQHMRQRFAKYEVIWLLGGDGNYAAKADRWARIGRTVFGSDGKGPLAGMHHCGLNWPDDTTLNEPWYNLAGIQSGHGDADFDLNWLTRTVPDNLHKARGKAIINLEPNYERHPAYRSHMLFGARQVRRAAWWSMLALPGAGVGYGHNSIWNWNSTPEHATGHEWITQEAGLLVPWRQALDYPGAIQMGILRRFFESQPNWWNFLPAPHLVEQLSTDPNLFVAAAENPADHRAILYKPAISNTLRLARSTVDRFPRLQWFNPATGQTRDPIATTPEPQAPNADDWVLILNA